MIVRQVSTTKQYLHTLEIFLTSSFNATCALSLKVILLMILRNVCIKSQSFDLIKHVKLIRSEKKLLFNANSKQMSVVTLNNNNNNKTMININKVIFNSNFMINATINVNNKSEYHVLSVIKCLKIITSHFKITSLRTTLLVIMTRSLLIIFHKNY